MEHTLPLLRGKVMPPPLPEIFLDRPRLDMSIQSRLDALPVLMVCATAGAGKTTAVRSALKNDERTAWLTIDAADASPGRLLTYIAAALAPFAAEVPELVKLALSSQAPHGEVAGLLIEALVGESRTTLVLDQLDRIADHANALDVIDHLMRFAPSNVRIILISRNAVTFPSSAVPGSERLDFLIDRELAFTQDEAGVALDIAGGSTDDIDAVMESTGGWVVGVLFAGTTAKPIKLALQPEIDPLHAYLWTHVLQGLDDELREFAISTSLLAAVDAPRAAALGLERTEGFLTELRAHRIPAVWVPGGKTVRYHPVLRDYLLVLLERRPRADVVALKVRFGKLLASEGFLIEATEELLSVAAYDQALPYAEQAIGTLIDRRDYDVADRWLDALAGHGQAALSPLTTAELMLAVAREEYWRGVRIADQLEALGQREALARSSSNAAAMMIWCYYHACRTDDITRVLTVAQDGPELEAARYLLTLIDEEPANPFPSSTAGVYVDGLVLRLRYWRGELAAASAPTANPATDAVVAPWRVAALRAVGELDEAHRLYERAQAAGVLTAGLRAVVGAELFTDMGREDDARSCIAQGRAEARRNGSVVWDLFSQLTEAKLELRLKHDPLRARQILEALERHESSRAYQSTAEQIDVWQGLCHLILREYESARVRLRRAMDSMRVSGRVLELPIAAVYLAEAAWHCGDEKTSDLASDIALAAARQQGTDEVILRALREFPEVLSRRLDGLATSDTDWHRLGSRILNGESRKVLSSTVIVQLHEFGNPKILIGGAEAKPRIAKCYELLAYLASVGSMTATRPQLLDALFDGRDTNTSRSYLRQVVHQLRSVLPDGVGPFMSSDTIGLAEHVSVESDARRFEQVAQRARSNDPRARLEEIQAALPILGLGDYLPKAKSEWFEGRRAEIQGVSVALRLESAQLAFDLGAYAQADDFAASVLADEPLREVAWRLRMRTASALGSYDDVLLKYTECVTALAAIGTQPARETKALLDQLR
ncbi:BTAD domain-containing putative transcriptional regulator [Paenarthrobacter sp. NPDC092416]|uniref:BTAD domain-containing putative transcriptional regulator n=1 Tax=Paenarthrobacter sp. NPDC092416 TaxID=3364386 RepID=UPI00381DD492